MPGQESSDWDFATKLQQQFNDDVSAQLRQRDRPYTQFSENFTDDEFISSDEQAAQSQQQGKALI